MSNRLFQPVIHQMKDAVDKTFGVLDSTFTVIACSELGKIGETFGVDASISAIGTDSFQFENYTCKVIAANQGSSYMVFVEGTDLLAEKYCNILTVAFAKNRQPHPDPSLIWHRLDTQPTMQKRPVHEPDVRQFELG